MEDDIDVIFITCDGLSDANEALINSKIYKTLEVVYISEIKNRNLVKGESKRSQTVFVDAEYHTKSSHFGFAFTTENISDLFNFTVALLYGSGNKITFPSNETKVPRGGSSTAATSKMERFAIIVNGLKPLTIITKHSILDVAAVLDPPLVPAIGFKIQIVK